MRPVPRPRRIAAALALALVALAPARAQAESALLLPVPQSFGVIPAATDDAERAPRRRGAPRGPATRRRQRAHDRRVGDPGGRAQRGGGGPRTAERRLGAAAGSRARAPSNCRGNALGVDHSGATGRCDPAVGATEASQEMVRRGTTSAGTRPGRSPPAPGAGTAGSRGCSRRGRAAAGPSPGTPVAPTAGSQRPSPRCDRHWAPERMPPASKERELCPPPQRVESPFPGSRTATTTSRRHPGSPTRRSCARCRLRVARPRGALLRRGAVLVVVAAGSRRSSGEPAAAAPMAPAPAPARARRAPGRVRLRSDGGGARAAFTRRSSAVGVRGGILAPRVQARFIGSGG